MMPEISGYIGSTHGVKAMPMPISSAHSGENGRLAGVAGCSVGAVLTAGSGAAVPALTASSGMIRVSGG